MKEKKTKITERYLKKKNIKPSTKNINKFLMMIINRKKKMFKKREKIKSKSIGNKTNDYLIVIKICFLPFSFPFKNIIF
jgi:hypothetical protein